MILRNLILVSAVLLLTLSSCSARIEGELFSGGAAELRLNLSLEPMTTALVRRLRAFVGDNAEAPLLDAQALSRSMAALPGIGPLSLKNSSSSSINGTVSVLNLVDFLSTAGGSRVITYTEGRNESSITINLDRESGPALIARLSPEAEEYLSALMAPAILGDTSTREEYLDLIAMVYGRPLADEIDRSRILVFLDLPRPVTAVKGGTARRNRAEFEIPLTDILVMERPLEFMVSW
jgi:hypothetical protein